MMKQFKNFFGLCLSPFFINVAQADTLQTHDDFNIALLGTSYTYREPSVEVKLTGPRVGFELENTTGFKNGTFFRVNGAYSYGLLTYTGSGTASYVEDWYVNVKGTVGVDRHVHGGVFSPYIGLGYRFLFDDPRGLSDTGAVGYRRISRYYYLPVGARYKVKNGNLPITFNVEAAYMYHGKQTSKDGDIGAVSGNISEAVDFGDINNHQEGGYNLNAGMMFTVNQWEFGPTINYWNIRRSDDQYRVDDNILYTIWEPANDTLEYTLKIVRHF